MRLILLMLFALAAPRVCRTQNPARVDVTPARITLVAGDTARIRAIARDGAGQGVPNAPIVWHSSNDALASVTPSGLVTARAPGMVGVTARSGVRTGTTSIIVLAPEPANPQPGAMEERAREPDSTPPKPPRRSAGRQAQRPPAPRQTQHPPVDSSSDVLATVTRSGSETYPHEPAGYEMLTKRDFSSKAKSDGDRGPAGSQGWDGAEYRSKRVTIVKDPTAPASPEGVLQFLYPAGFRGGSAPGLSQFVIRKPVTSLYISMWVKLSSNFDGHRSNTNKIFHMWIAGGNKLFVSAEGEGARRLQPQIRLQGVTDPRARLLPNEARGAEVARGRWQRWEFMLAVNTPGQANGRAQWWIDGRKVSDHRDIRLLEPGQRPAWQQFQLSPTWGGGGANVSRDMYLWVDEVYISGR